MDLHLPPEIPQGTKLQITKAFPPSYGRSRLPRVRVPEGRTGANSTTSHLQPKNSYSCSSCSARSSRSLRLPQLMFILHLHRQTKIKSFTHQIGVLRLLQCLQDTISVSYLKGMLTKRRLLKYPATLSNSYCNYNK